MCTVRGGGTDIEMSYLYCLCGCVQDEMKFKLCDVLYKLLLQCGDILVGWLVYCLM